MKSAYLFAAILAPGCLFAQPLDHDEEKGPKPGLAREILRERSPQTSEDNNGVGNAISYPPSDVNDSDADIPQPDPPSHAKTAGIIGKRQFYPGDYKNSSIQIDFYANAHCEGPHHSNITLKYDIPIAHQFQSYRLHQHLGRKDMLGAYADVNWNHASKPVDPSLENNSAACQVFAYALAATAQDKKAGCHSLDTRVGCIDLSVVDDDVVGVWPNNS